MATQTKIKPAKFDASRYHGLDREALIRIYRAMFLSRRLDDREIQLKRQNKIYFQISGAGHEAVLAAAGLVLRPNYDWFFPHYRDRALMLMLGVTPLDMLLQGVGAKDDPASGGRQMPSHWGHRDFNIFTRSSPTGTQFLPAIGAAEAGAYYEKFPKAAEQARKAPLGGQTAFHRDELVYVSSGEGTTSQGEFFESLNTASNKQLPGPLSHRRQRLRHFRPGRSPDRRRQHFKIGEDLPASATSKNVTAPTRSTATPSSAAPPPTAANAKARLWFTRTSLVRIRIRFPTTKNFTAAKTNAPPKPSATRFRNSPSSWSAKASSKNPNSKPSKPTSTAKLSKPPIKLSPPKCRRPIPFTILSTRRTSIPRPKNSTPSPKSTATRKPWSKWFRPRFSTKCSATPASSSSAKTSPIAATKNISPRVKGKGGVFKATSGLQRKFGSDRVFNSPLAEANIIGRSIGMAARGLKPVPEIQFFDYIWPAMMQLRNELATIRWRSGGNFKAPVVVRVAIGGYLTGGAIYHSQCGEVVFTHIPGLRVVMPSTALDVCGLLRTAIRSDDPVLFLEHKHLYRQPYNRSEYPGPDFTIPFGKANVVREGTDVSIITYGAVVHRAEVAAAELARNGISAEVLDLRTLSPYDWEAIVATVQKTNRVIVAYEDTRSWGYGAEIAARIADELFYDLDGPVRRVAATDTFCAYQPQLEDAILPQTDDLVRAVRDLVAF